MSLIPREDLVHLGEMQGGMCISLYLPTHRAGQDVEQDRIQLKNLLQDAEAQLQAAGYPKGRIDALLDLIREQLVPPSTFWQHQLDGLCIFRSEELLDAYRLPFSFEQLASVGPRFHLKPLLPVLSGDGQFYLLTLSKGGINVYQGTRYGMSELELENLPPSVVELLREGDHERPPQQWHTGSQTPGGHPRASSRPAMFHGHGAFELQQEVGIVRYFRRIDEALAPIWSDERLPLVLAGGDDLVPLYREANSYPHVVEEDEIDLNPASLAPQALHELAWEIVQPRFEAEAQRAEEDFKMWAGRDSERASGTLEEVVPAAYFERVKVLFAAVDVQRWGSFKPESGEIRLDDGPTAENQDLLELAAVQTLLNDGTIYAREGSEIPGRQGLAAIFRY